MTARALVATLNKYTRNFVEPGTLEQRVLTNMLMRFGSVEFSVGGANQEWPVRYQRVGNFREYDAFQDVVAAPTTSEIMVSESFGRYIQSEFIDDEEELINRGDKEKIYDLYQTKTKALGEDGKDELHGELHNGPGTGRRITGLNLLLPTTLGTVHGQAQTGNAWWQHVILDAAAGPSSDDADDLLERIRTGLMSADRGDAAGRPNFGLTTMSIYERIVDKHQQSERYLAAGNTLGGELKFITVHECPIFYDKQAEANTLRLLNGRKIKLQFRTPGIFKPDVQRPSNKRGKLLVMEYFPCLTVRNMRYHTTIEGYSF